MQDPEVKVIEAFKRAGVDLVCTLPCDRVKGLIALAERQLRFVRLTREEEGVGIAAGVAMAGRRPALIVQSSGLGNMVNALLSLTHYYGLPLPIFISHRGVYKEAIAAQVPFGQALTAILSSMGMQYTQIEDYGQLDGLAEELAGVYAQGRAHAFILSPRLWESSGVKVESSGVAGGMCAINSSDPETCPPPSLRRFGVLEALRDVLRGQVVICNLGIPAKELHQIVPQKSNFYMLGSMGMVTPIGLGVSLFTDKRVFVIDGDGSILMNPGSLATVAAYGAGNLTIIAIDNAAYGSTGSQPTLTSTCVDISSLARAMGIRHIRRASEPERIASAVLARYDGPALVHIPALPGNDKSPNIEMSAHEIRDGFMGFLKRS